MKWPWSREELLQPVLCLDCGERIAVCDASPSSLAVVAEAHRPICPTRHPEPEPGPEAKPLRIFDDLSKIEFRVEVVPPPDPALVLMAKQYREGKLALCPYCSGLHLRMGVGCPRVKRIVGQPLPDALLEVEFWRDGMFDAGGITWPEELAAVEIPSEEQAP